MPWKCGISGLAIKSSRAEFLRKGMAIKARRLDANRTLASAWDSLDNAMPEAVSTHIQWPDDVVVYFVMKSTKSLKRVGMSLCVIGSASCFSMMVQF